MRVIAGVLLVTVACSASAQLYRWTDASGRTHYTDSPPPAGAKNVQKKAQKSTRPPTQASKPQDPAASASASAVRDPYAVQVARKNAPVTLYTGPQCEPCDSARSLLNGRAVPFKEVLVRDEQTAEAFKQAVGGGIVPSIVVGASAQPGFQEAAYHALLDAAGYPKKGILPARKQPAPAAPAAPGHKGGEQASSPTQQPARPSAPKGPYLPR